MIKATWLDGTNQTYDSMKQAYLDFANQLLLGKGFPVSCEQDGEVMDMSLIRVSTLVSLKNRLGSKSG